VRDRRLIWHRSEPICDAMLWMLAPLQLQTPSTWQWKNRASMSSVAQGVPHDVPGKAIALALAGEGMNLKLVGRSTDKLQKVLHAACVTSGGADRKLHTLLYCCLALYPPTLLPTWVNHAAVLDQLRNLRASHIPWCAGG
jgi:hypothetical protein